MSVAVEKTDGLPISTHESILRTAKKKHPLLAGAIEKNGCIDIRSSRDGSIVEFLAGTVISQQLSAQASNTIWQRVCDLRVHTTDGFNGLFVDENSDKLRACGISRAKVKAIVQMNESHKAGGLRDEEIRKLSYEGVIRTITSLWGFGEWSADMVAMFFVKVPDVWPLSDAGLIRGMRALAPEEVPNEAAMLYSPHRTYLARHVWKAVDTGLILD